mgnify:CR=1 FL=1
MKLIDLYVADVGRRLPEKMRPEIENELRSLLEDMLEDRARQAGRPADEEMASVLLKEYGSPAKIAASYLPERYLVGPDLFPTYLQVLKVVVLVALVVTTVGFALTFSQSARGMKDLVGGIFEGINGIIQAGVQALGIITRAGIGSKIILAGDPDQIDHPRLDRRTNGLVYASERMKGSALCWQTTFESHECTRSPLALDAAQRMTSKGLRIAGKV